MITLLQFIDWCFPVTYQRQYLSTNSGPLALTTCLPPLPRCSLSLRQRDCRWISWVFAVSVCCACIVNSGGLLEWSPYTRWHCFGEEWESHRPGGIYFNDPVTSLGVLGTGILTPLAMVKIHCFDLSSAPGKSTVWKSKILCELNPKFILPLQEASLMDMGENESLSIWKKGHIHADW